MIKEAGRKSAEEEAKAGVAGAKNWEWMRDLIGTLITFSGLLMEFSVRVCHFSWPRAMGKRSCAVFDGAVQMNLRSFIFSA